MKSKYLLLIGAALWCLFTAVNPVFAQITAFTYAGQLNVGGNPANGGYDFVFKSSTPPAPAAASAAP